MGNGDMVYVSYEKMGEWVIGDMGRVAHEG